MSFQSNRVRHEHASLSAQVQSRCDAAERENRDPTAEELASNAAALSRMQLIESQVANVSQFESLQLPPPSADEIARGALPTAPPAATPVAPLQPMATLPPTRSQIRDAFNAWGFEGRRPTDPRLNFVDIGGTGAIVPPEVIDVAPTPRGVNVFRDAVRIAGMVPISTPTTTAALVLPLATSLPGRNIAEDAHRGDGEMFEISYNTNAQIPLYTRTYTSGLAVLPNTQSLSIPFDFLAYVTSDLTFSKEHGLETDIAQSIAGDASITQLVTTASTTGFTMVELLALAHSLPDKFDRLKVIFLSRTAFERAELLTDSITLSRDPQNPGVLRLPDGTAVMKVQAFSPITAGNTVGIVVSMLGFRLRDSAQKVTRSTNVPQLPDATAVELFGYHAFGYDPAAIAKLRTSAA